MPSGLSPPLQFPNLDSTKASLRMSTAPPTSVHCQLSVVRGILAL
jgi:hypothetical protein